jgi:hypothetical protein
MPGQPLEVVIDARFAGLGAPSPDLRGEPRPPSLAREGDSGLEGLRVEVPASGECSDPFIEPAERINGSFREVRGLDAVADRERTSSLWRCIRSEFQSRANASSCSRRLALRAMVSWR